MGIILIIIYLLFTSSGLVLMKLGGNSGTVQLDEGTIKVSANLISFLGMVLYILSFLLFTKIITMYDLSIIYPFSAGVVQIVSLVAGYFLFKEQLNVMNVVGVIVITFGIFLVTRR